MSIDKAGKVMAGSTYGISGTVIASDFFGNGLTFFDQHAWMPALALGLVTMIGNFVFKYLEYKRRGK